MNNSDAIVFPGQGSQSVGMLADIATRYSIVNEVFAEASEVLGYDLWQLTQAGPAEALDKTEHTQPALLAASYAVWRIIQAEFSYQPALLAGHSLGEYTALVCANAVTFSDAIKLVAARGRYMQAAVKINEGAMAALIGLDEQAVAKICADAVESNEVLSPANFNCIGQIVIAGHRTAVLRAVASAKEQGAKLAVLIPVSVPSHCALMHPAAEKLAALLKTIKIEATTIPVINNVDVIPYSNADSIRDGLVRQLYMPVRWVEIIQLFIKSGITTIIECGPGKVLTGLHKRIDKSLPLTTTSDLASLESLLKTAAERSS